MSNYYQSEQFPEAGHDRSFQLPSIPLPPLQPGTLPPLQPGTLPPMQPGVPQQLTPSHLTSILSQHQRPFGQPPGEIVFLYNLLKSNPAMLQMFIQQRPQSLQQAVQFAQFGSSVPRYPDERVLPGFCYNRWSLVFTFTDVYLMWPVTNFFGFVIGYCYPYLTPCFVPDFQILFALC